MGDEMPESRVLSDNWRFQPDPVGEGELLGYHLSDIDDSLWKEVTIPCIFDDIGSEFKSYEGCGWFRCDFNIKNSELSLRILLYFGACNYRTKVYVNGKKVFENLDGFLPFEVDVTSLVHAGINKLAVCVDNSRRISDVPGNKRGWRPFGGIIRPVILKVKYPVGIEWVGFRGEANGYYEASVEWYNVLNTVVTGNICLYIRDKQNNCVVNQEAVSSFLPGKGSMIFNGLCKKVQTWSPSSPYLYSLQICLRTDEGYDELNTKIGFRTIRTDNCSIKLNGSIVKMNGFNRHEDSMSHAVKPDYDTARNDLMKMKALGANFVRLAHYPHDSTTLDICDELGLFVMAEIPLYWMGRGDETASDITSKITNAQRQIERMVRRDFNHPSIVFWSVSNETEEDRPEVEEGNRKLLKFVKKLDPSRLAVHVSHIDSDRFIHEDDDVICINGYPGVNCRFAAGNRNYNFDVSKKWWEERLNALHQKYPLKPIFVTECGYVGWKGIYGGVAGEDVQAIALEAELGAIDMDFVCGRAVWCYADHPWPEEPFLNYVTLSPYGIFTRDRKPKKAVDIIRKIFSGDLPTVYSPPLDNYPVCMFRPHMNDIPEYNFPEGFSIRPMTVEDGALWEDIWRDSEPFIKIPPGLFYQEFGENLLAIPKRCFFIVDSKGCAVGTISAWYNNNYKGKKTGRIHWLAIRPSFQGRNLARAALSYALKQMAKWHSSVMLATSTGRIKAIKLYLDFGFLPEVDTPETAKAWQLLKLHLSHPVLEKYCVSK